MIRDAEWEGSLLWNRLLDAESMTRPHKGDQDELGTHYLPGDPSLESEKKQSHVWGYRSRVEWLLGMYRALGSASAS